MTLVLAFVAAGCGSSGDDTTSSSQDTSAAAGSTEAASDSVSGNVSLLAPFNITPWPQYYIADTVEAIETQMPGVEVSVLTAETDQAKQLSDIEASVSQAADLVLYAPVNPLQSSAGLAKLAAGEIPTVAYVHDALEGPLDGFIWVDVPATAEYWGNYLEENLVKDVGKSPVKLAIQLGDPTFKFYEYMQEPLENAVKKLEDAGEVEVVCNADTPGWAPEAAQKAMDQCLTKTGDQVDAVLVMNDSTADGVAASLQGAGLQNEVKIYGGHDATLTAIQRVAAGQQIATFMPDYKSLNQATADMVQEVLEGKALTDSSVVNATFDNGFDAEVPSYFAPEIPITEDKIQEVVVDGGYYSKKEICTGVAVNSPFCKG